MTLKDYAMKNDVKRSIFSLLSMNFTRFQSKVMISNGVLYLE